MNGKVAKAIRKTVYRGDSLRDERIYKSRFFKKLLFTWKKGKIVKDADDKPIMEWGVVYTMFNKPLSRRAIYQRLKKEYRERKHNGEQKLLHNIKRGLQNIGRRNAQLAECA